MVSIRLLSASLGFSILASAGCGNDGALPGDGNSSGGSGAESGSTSTGGAGHGGSTAGVAGASAGSAAGGASAGAGASDHGGSSSGGTGGTAATGGGAGTATTGGGAGMATGGGAGTAGGPGKECVDRTCAASEACVAYRTVGGAVIAPADAGACPPNAHLEGQTCMANFAYQCVAQPGCPAGQIDCTCGMCPPTYFSCHVAGTSQWLDPDAELTCELLAP